MKNRIKQLILVGLVLTFFTNGLDALPAGLYDAVKTHLGGMDWTPITFNGRAYTEQQQLTASDGAADGLFGYAVAIDGNMAMIGVPTDDISGSIYQGSVYVFERSGSTWTETQKLLASDGAEEDEFGHAIALHSKRAVIGAPFKFDRAAYVFELEGTTWVEKAKLIPTGPTPDYPFGDTVALDKNTAVVGARADLANQGSAFVFIQVDATTWDEEAKLTASDGAVDDYFGGSVAIDGDTIAVGACFDDVGANTNQGSAYVFTRTGNIWTEQQQLTASDGAADDLFGCKVALDGDTALVGAPDADIAANTDQGAAYEFTRSGTTWTEGQKLTASDGAVDDNFGSQVAISGTTAVIGAADKDIAANVDQGSAYVFELIGGVWTEQIQLIASDGAAGDRFSEGVAVDKSTVLIGARYNDVGANVDQGSVYVFEDSVGTELIANGGFENSEAAPWIIKNASGDKVKCNKDKDGDGIPDKIVAYEANCAFQFKNVVGEAGKIQQDIDLSGIVPAIGDTLDLSFFAQSKASATVKAKVIFKYDDDTKTKITVESSGAETYTEFTGSGSLTNANIVKSKISFKSSQTAGKVYIDQVSLLHNPSQALNLIPLPAAPSANRLR